MSFLSKRFLASAGRARLESHDAQAKGSGSLAPAAATGPRKHESVLTQIDILDASARYSESLMLVNKALAAKPDQPELIVARASTLFAWGRFWEARSDFLEAEARGARHPTLNLQLGWSCQYTGRLEEAEDRMRRAIGEDPFDGRAQFGLAAVLQALRRLDEAIACYERGAELRPSDFQAQVMIGLCKLDQGHSAAAEESFRRAIAIDDRTPIAWANLGVSIARQDRIQDAFEPFERAVRLEEAGGAPCDSFVNLATNLREAGRTEEALDLYERNLVQRPNIDGLGDYALTLLTDGRLKEGWRFYEFRWTKAPLLALRPGFSKPVWSGQDLRGKTILVCVEQGFGDTIQFIRYAPMLKSLGATVLLKIRTGLEALAADFPGVDRVYDRDAPLPPFDFYINLMSLPHAFGTDIDSIPADIPYIDADPVRVERWASRVTAGSELKVGVVWAGNPSHVRDRLRSISLLALAPLFGVKGVRFYSLQQGPAVAEAEGLPPDLEFVNLGPELEDFRDTAAVISLLDLVVCVDTVVAHLAGALGKPVWLLLPKPADFRWLDHREDSPWYPTMRLFRQKTRGAWDDVVAEVAGELHLRLRQRAPETPTSYAELGRGPATSIGSEKPLAVSVLKMQNGMSAVAETRVGILQYFPDQSIIGRSIAWYGEFLQAQLELLGRLIRPDAVLMEIGAGVGAHSVFLAERIDATGHLFIYEPGPVVQRLLRQNLAANRLTNYTLMRRALVGKRAPAEVEGGASITVEAWDTATAASGDETLDELQLKRLDWLKVNNGDTALDILDGAEETLWRLRPLLFVAATDELNLTELADRAKTFSYRCWRMQTPLHSPHNFNCREMDIFSRQAALALLAIPEEIEVDVALSGCDELR